MTENQIKPQATNSESTTQENPWTDTLRVTLLLLTCTAGVIDGTSYLQLDKVFPANMTGNTVLLALRVGGAHSGPVLGNLVALLGFCVGAAIGTITHQEKHSFIPKKLTRTIVVELLLVSAGALLWQFTGDSFSFALIGLLSLAMGLQAAIALRIAVNGVSSVAITNTLVRAMTLVVSPLRHSSGDDSARLPVLYLAAVWVAYFVGALVAALLIRVGLNLNFLLPVGLLLAVLLLVIRARDQADTIKN